MIRKALGLIFADVKRPIERIETRPFLAPLLAEAKRDIERQFARDTIPSWVAGMVANGRDAEAVRARQISHHIFEIKMRAARRAKKRRFSFDVLLRGDRPRNVAG